MSEGETPTVEFEDLGLANFLVKNCRKMRMRWPTDIQQKCIPSVISGSDVIGRAKTGSGKTAAFALPMLHVLSQDLFGVFGIILTPARELAMQIAEQFDALGENMGLQTAVVIGGQDMNMQAKQLESSPHIIIATPGRLADHVRSGTRMNLEHVQFFVLDEADRLLDESFERDISTISKTLPDSSCRQTLLFSATMTDGMKHIKELSMKKNALFYEVSQTQHTVVDKLDQRYMFMPAKAKDTYLMHILQEHEEQIIIVFVQNKKECELIGEMLVQLEMEVVSLHSNLNQARRLAALGKFRSGQSRILVATDVASRGLDIPEVNLVINYNVPRVTADYVHRVGRTARAGKKGQAVTLVSQYEVELLYSIEELIERKLEEKNFSLPDTKLLELMSEVSAAKRMARIRLHEFDLTNQEKKRLDSTRKRSARKPRSAQPSKKTKS